MANFWSPLEEMAFRRQNPTNDAVADFYKDNAALLDLLPQSVPGTPAATPPVTMPKVGGGGIHMGVGADEWLSGYPDIPAEMINAEAERNRRKPKTPEQLLQESQFMYPNNEAASAPIGTIPGAPVPTPGVRPQQPNGSPAAQIALGGVPGSSVMTPGAFPAPDTGGSVAGGVPGVSLGTFPGSATGRPYEIGQTYAGKNGFNYIAQPDGTFKHERQDGPKTPTVGGNLGDGIGGLMKNFGGLFDGIKQGGVGGLLSGMFSRMMGDNGAISSQMAPKSREDIAKRENMKWGRPEKTWAPDFMQRGYTHRPTSGGGTEYSGGSTPGGGTQFSGGSTPGVSLGSGPRDSNGNWNLDDLWSAHN